MMVVQWKMLYQMTMVLLITECDSQGGSVCEPGGDSQDLSFEVSSLYIEELMVS